jgi:hypothetical protein
MNTTNTTFNATTHPQNVWPLPGIKLPNAHLTWARWLDLLAKRTAVGQPERVATKRAA